MSWLLRLLSRVYHLTLFADADNELHCRFLVGYARPFLDKRQLALEIGRGVARIGHKHLLPGGWKHTIWAAWIGCLLRGCRLARAHVMLLLLIM
jgi:hypothetical protein